MDTFAAPDGTLLAYHRTGDGPPLVCLPGGPMMSSGYLADLDGMTSLVRLDPRGTGDSAAVEVAACRCDRQVDDVEALRTHLGLARMDLLGHSAGGSLAVLYAARYPERVARLVLVTPSPRVVGVEITDADRRAVAELRRGEDWFPDAFAAFERIWAGEATEADWEGIAPFSYGRWDAASRANLARQDTEINADAAREFYAAGALDPDATRAALTGLPAPVLLVAGEYHRGLPPKAAAEYAGLFPDAELVVAPASGHYPWLDDPAGFARTVTEWLTKP